MNDGSNEKTSFDPKALSYNVPSLTSTEIETEITGAGNQTFGLEAIRSGHNKHTFLIVAVVLFILLCGAGTYYYFFYKRQPELPTENVVTPVGTQTPVGVETTTELTRAEWTKKYFKTEHCENIELCGDNADADQDGMKVIDEFKYGTDPNNKDSDKDEIADGDEFHIFGSNPLSDRTAGDPKYTDKDYIANGFNPLIVGKKYTLEELETIKTRVKALGGVHQPTLSGLGLKGAELYGLSKEDESIPGVDTDPKKVIERDVARNESIRAISIGVMQYMEANKKYPKVQNMAELLVQLKPYIKDGTIGTDPINKGKYVFSYELKSTDEFELRYVSETEKTVIRVDKNTASEYRNASAASENDQKRIASIELIRDGLINYYLGQAVEESAYPLVSELEKVLVPGFLDELPNDPETGLPFEYVPDAERKSFKIKTKLEKPLAGKNGYECDSSRDCRYY